MLGTIFSDGESVYGCEGHDDNHCHFKGACLFIHDHFESSQKLLITIYYLRNLLPFLILQMRKWMTKKEFINLPEVTRLMVTDFKHSCDLWLTEKWACVPLDCPTFLKWGRGGERDEASRSPSAICGSKLGTSDPNVEMATWQLAFVLTFETHLCS